MRRDLLTRALLIGSAALILGPPLALLRSSFIREHSDAAVQPASSGTDSTGRPPNVLLVLLDDAG